jgi:Uncharacterized conserved protein (DUF2190)
MLSNLLQTGPFTFITATLVDENTLVQIDANGKLVVCGADLTPAGHTLYYYAAGATATLYQCIGQSTLRAGGAVAIGDLCKSNAVGRVICNGTTGSTVNDLKTVCVALSASSADGDYIKVQFVRCA